MMKTNGPDSLSRVTHTRMEERKDGNRTFANLTQERRIIQDVRRGLDLLA